MCSPLLVDKPSGLPWGSLHPQRGETQGPALARQQILFPGWRDSLRTACDPCEPSENQPQLLMILLEKVTSCPPRPRLLSQRNASLELLLPSRIHRGREVKTLHGADSCWHFWAPGSSHVWSNNYPQTFVVTGTIRGLSGKYSALSFCHLPRRLLTNLMHRSFRTGEEWQLDCKSSLSVIPESAWRSLNFPWTMSEVFASVLGLPNRREEL